MPVDVDAEVLSNTRLSPEYNVIAFAAPEIARQARPGQFVMVRPTRGLDPLLRRPFSVFEILHDDSGAPAGISIYNKRVGRGTRLLYDVNPGERLSVLGPLGQSFEPVDPPAAAWMVAGGVGLAPFLTLAQALTRRGTATTLYYGGRAVSDLHHRELFERLGISIVLATEDGTAGTRGRVTAPLERAIAARSPGSPATVYACGPTPMMRAVTTLATKADIPVFVSLEPVMGCGMGGCYSCVVPVHRGAGSHFVRSCLEGPVFDGARLIWDGLTAH